MITGIVLENFKCFERVEIHPKRVTCFVGANGTGKSSVLQAFGLLKQSVAKVPDDDRPLAIYQGYEFVCQGPFVNLADDRDIIKKYMPKSPVWSLSGKLYFGDQVLPFCYGARLSDGKLMPDPAISQETPNAILVVLESVRIIPAIRGLVQPSYLIGEELVKDISLQGGLSQQEEQTATNLAYSRYHVERISPLLKRVTGVGLRAETVPPRSVSIDSLTVSGRVNIVGEGFGANSLIMLLLQLVSAEKGATVMIEEPEIHLHPRAQAELAEVLTEAALKEDKQVIVTTHSEHITGRLLTLVAEGKLTPDDVAIYAFEKDEKGVCTAKDLRVNSDGTIEGGINDFFETNLKEMNRFAQAQFDRLKPSE
ncbi:MAG: AAA family ATPase [Chloroflexota bacterium]|nr:AAA family ATPase [Chloroflexota bacterium]